MKFDTGNLLTAGMLLGLLFVLSMVPRLLGEGFTNMAPSPVIGKASPIGEFDLQKNPPADLTLGDAKSGNVLAVQAGGSAFASPVNPEVDAENNQLYAFLRNETGQDAQTCLMSPYSSSTGCIKMTKQDVIDHDTRGGNRAVDMYI